MGQKKRNKAKTKTTTMKFQAIAPVLSAAVLSNVQAAPIDATNCGHGFGYQKKLHRAVGPVRIAGFTKGYTSPICAHQKQPSENGPLSGKGLNNLIALKSGACNFDDVENKFWLLFEGEGDSSNATNIAIVNEANVNMNLEHSECAEGVKDASGKLVPITTDFKFKIARTDNEEK